VFEAQSIATCPKCGCAAWSWANQDGFGHDCMACGHWYRAERGGEDQVGGGFGVAAYHSHDEMGDTWFPLDEASQHPFAPDELAQMDWAWFSRPVSDGRWEGVVVKGTPLKLWVIGIIPHYQEEGNDDGGWIELEDDVV
jgi:hypothetical protein